MIKYFIIGLFVGGVLGYTMAALMSVIDKGDDGL
jgi:hypothetical protein